MPNKTRSTMAWAMVAAMLTGCFGNNGSGDGDDTSGGEPSASVSSACAARSLPGSPIALAPAFPNLMFTNPVAMLQAPGDTTRWFVVEKAGRVRVFPNHAAVADTAVTTYIDITGNVASGPGEAGLLGMAFHPSFPSNPRVYLSYTRPGSPLVSVIAAYTSSDGGMTLNAGSAQEILTINQPFENHNGGQISFGPDGMLYIGFGDGGSGGDPQGNAQSTNTLLGKMLRIDVDGGTPYAIPPGNPFALLGGRPEIFAWGFRNPWRWSFDRTTGELWVADVGQDDWEEINKVVVGGNYGWRCREGAHDFNTAGCTSLTLIDPVTEYANADGRCSVTGGYVYRGSAVSALFGSYLFGDFCSGEIWSTDALGGSVELVADSGVGISSFAEANDGELYVLAFGDNGCVMRVTPPPSS